MKPKKKNLANFFLLLLELVFRQIILIKFIMKLGYVFSQNPTYLLFQLLIKLHSLQRLLLL